MLANITCEVALLVGLTLGGGGFHARADVVWLGTAAQRGI